MPPQRILIVDDEPSVLSVLKRSLETDDGTYEIVTALDGFIALEELEKAPFDLVVSDYRMADMDGLELLEAVRKLQPRTRVILMTAYGTNEVEAEARRLQAYQLLAKPLQVSAFRSIVREALTDFAISRPGILILSDERYRKVVERLGGLRGDVGANCVFLADWEGHAIAQVGTPQSVPLEQLSGLVGAGIASFMEAGHLVDKDPNAICLAHRAGVGESLYAANIGAELLLILLVHNAEYATRIGSVWFYTQQAAKDLQGILSEAEFVSPDSVLGVVSQSEVAEVLGNLFDLGGPKDSQAGSRPQSPLLSFEEAMSGGLMRRSDGDVPQASTKEIAQPEAKSGNPPPKKSTSSAEGAPREATRLPPWMNGKR